jgi:hypothetical protein
MPSLVHDALLTLFRNRPTLAAELLHDALHAPVPAFEHVRVGDASLSEVVPTEYRADLVLLLERGQGPEMALVVEAQLGRDPDKRWWWPVYLTGLRARLRCDVALVVVTDNAGVASCAAAPIATGHPGWILTPLVLGPSAVPAVHDVAAASRAPELAVLSAMVHGHDDDAVDIAMAALAAASGLDEERAKLYSDLVFWSVHEEARAMLEALMATGNWEYQSDFARRYVAQGRAEGRVEGRAEGRVEGRAGAVLAVLAARHIHVPDDMRTRIAGCADLAILDRWLSRAANASSLADVMDE